MNFYTVLLHVSARARAYLQYRIYTVFKLGFRMWKSCVDAKRVSFCDPGTTNFMFGFMHF